MNCFLIIISYLFIISINAQLNITRKIPNITISTTTHQFIFEIDTKVNQPQFQSFIRMYNVTTNTTLTTNTSLAQIDVHNNASNVTYANNTLIFYMPGSIQFNTNDEFSITFDAGVLFSNSTLNSTASFDYNFWHLKVIAGNNNSLETSTIITDTSIGTTYSAMTASSTAHSDTSAFRMTTMISTYTSMKKITTTVTWAQTTGGGRTAPSRSAQWGMGLGIVFITIIIVGEIIYFKYFYSGSQRSGSYYT